MASPVTAALATLWLQDGTADAVIESIRRESVARQKIAAELLPAHSYIAHPEGFHLWLALPAPWQRAAFAAQMRASDLSIVISDAFCVSDTPPEAVRVSLGGMLSRAEVRNALDYLAHVLEEKKSLPEDFM
jgi:DNA-binding transcriptional MocR family regulator